MSVFDSRFINLCDAELKSEDGESFRVHRIILAMKSEYFYSMFCGMNENRRQFRIPGVSGNCLGEILKYIYTGEVPDAEQNLDLMLAADYLCLADLRLKVKQHLVKNMGLTIANCLPLLNTAYHTNDEDIILRNFRFVERNFKEILLTQKDYFLELSPEVLKNILGSRNLNVCSETAVWLSIVEWASKDVRTRSQCMPQLLMCLARNGLGENLAREILQHHRTVFENIFMKDSADFTSHLDALLYFLENRCSIKRPLHNRLPSRLHVISHGVDDKFDEDGTWHLYITYDETMDLWRKIGESVDCNVMFSTVVGHNIYLFGWEWCRKFDIIKQQWMPMANFQTDSLDSPEDLSTFEVDGFIYRIGTCLKFYRVSMQVYDTVNDRWFDGGTLMHIIGAKAVTLNKKIYVVGHNPAFDAYERVYGNEMFDDNETANENKMAASMFDSVTKRWENLPPPVNVDCFDFALLIYRGKMYAIGGESGLENEVFDPQTNMWEDFPSVPCTLELVQAIVFEDQIIAYGLDSVTDAPTAYCWNRVEEKWKEFERSASIDFRRFRFSTVEDVDTIRSATKLSRDQGVRLEKSLFG